MSGHIRILLKVVAFAALACACGATPVAQTSAEEFRSVLLKQAAFTGDEFSALERGEVVAKLLPAADKREVAFCGVLRLQGTPETLLAALKESLAQQNNRVILGGRKFSTPPAPEDLQALTLEKNDIEDMKQCAVGDCNLQMSAAMIERMQREVDWAAPDYRAQATRLFRLMLFDYVRDYLARGDAALIEYNDRASAVRLDGEQRSLLTSLPYVNDSAPEFADYLKNFPRPELPRVENVLHWSKVKLGLKPVIVITHTAVYTRLRGNAPQIMVVTKQIYASHYFDSSLSLTLLTSAPPNGATSDAYLLYANRSRADTLGGLFGGVKRRVIEGGALEGLLSILKQTERIAEARLANQSGPDTRAETHAAGPRLWARWLFSWAQYPPIVLAAVAVLLLMWLRRRDLKAHGA